MGFIYLQSKRPCDAPVPFGKKLTTLLCSTFLAERNRSLNDRVNKSRDICKRQAEVIRRQEADLRKAYEEIEVLKRALDIKAGDLKLAMDESGICRVPFSTRSALSPATIRASSRLAAEEALVGRRGEGLRSGHHARVGKKLVTKSALLCEVARGRRKYEEAESKLQEAQSALSTLRSAYHDVIEKNKEVDKQSNIRANELRKLEVQCTESSARVVELEASVSGLQDERVGLQCR